MKKIIYLVLILFGAITSQAQTSADTLYKFVSANKQFNDVKVYGLTTNNHVYDLGVNLYPNYPATDTLIQLVRMDLTNKTATSKKYPASILNFASALTLLTFDSAGAFYLTNGTDVFRFNLKDSISFIDLGGNKGAGTIFNPVNAGGYSAYVASLGRDKHVYFGSANTNDETGVNSWTYWSEYTPPSAGSPNGVLTKYHTPIDMADDYVLAIAGDSLWAYMTIGQVGKAKIYAVRKSTGVSTLLSNQPAGSRPGFGVYQNGIFTGLSPDADFGLAGGTYQLVNGALVAVTNPVYGKALAYTEVAGAPTNGYTYSKDLSGSITSYNNLNDSVYIMYDSSFAKNTTFSVVKSSLKVPSTSIPADISSLFSFANDPSYIYGYGGTYGNVVKYRIPQDSATILGPVGMNMYSWVEAKNGKMYFGGYPSGQLVLWDTTKPWTVGKVINYETYTNNTPNANPQGLVYFRSGIPGVEQGVYPNPSMHHLTQIALLPDSSIFGTGNQIRTGYNACLGVYNPATKGLYAYNYTRHPQGLSANNFLPYNGNFLWSTEVYSGGPSSLYTISVPNDSTIQVTDSLNLGFNSYGTIFMVGDQLIGFADDRVYKIDMVTRTIVDSIKFGTSCIGATMFTDGRVVIYNGGNCVLPTIPKSFWNVSLSTNVSWFQKDKNVYASVYIPVTSHRYIVRYNNFITNPDPITKGAGRLEYLQSMLNLPQTQ